VAAPSKQRAPAVAFEPAEVEAICNALGETERGLSGTEIGRLLKQCSIRDLYPSDTKRHRLREALNQHQANHPRDSTVARFIAAAMAPARYAQNRQRFEQLRELLNKALIFSGLSVNQAGELAEAPATAHTLDEAEELAGRLRDELARRGVHAVVLEFCRAELLDEDYFHAVLEATKSVAERVRQTTGLQSDGCPLVDDAFDTKGLKRVRLRINDLQSDSEINEHKGFANLLRGMFQMFRNPTAHDPRIAWHVGEAEALDLLTLVSFLHRRLDDSSVSIVECPGKASHHSLPEDNGVEPHPPSPEHIHHTHPP